MSPPEAMPCVEFVERVNDYLQGAISGEDRTRLEAHLAICPHCVHYLDQIRTVRDQAPSVAATDIPDHVRADLLQAFGNWRGGRGEPTHRPDL